MKGKLRAHEQKERKKGRKKERKRTMIYFVPPRQWP